MLGAELLRSWGLWALKCAIGGTAACASTMYVKRTSLTTPPGMQRLAKWWPVLLLYTLLPLVFDVRTEQMSRACCAAMTLWLANFKLLLLIMGRGPLTDSSLTNEQFMALLVGPILHKEGPDGKPLRLPADADRAQLAKERLVWRAPENFLLMLISGATLASRRVPTFIKTYSGAFGVCTFCGLWANALAALVIWAWGLDVAPSWDRPWLQNSLSDFWSRRWNLPAAYTLRTLVFEPLCEGRAVRKVKLEDAYPDASAEDIAAIKAHGGTPATSTGAGTSSKDEGHTEYVDVEVVKGSGKSMFKATVTDTGSAAVEGAGGVVQPAGRLAAQDASKDATHTATAVADSMDEAVLAAEKLAHSHDAPATTGEVSGLRRRAAAPAAEGDQDVTASIKLVDGSTKGKDGLQAAADAAAAAAPSNGAAAATTGTSRGAGRNGRPRVPAARRLAALTATFFVSGLMHEILLLVCTGWRAYAPGMGRQLLYFMLQVPNSIVEQKLARTFKALKWSPPDYIAIPFTSLSLQIPGKYLFWRPIFNAAWSARNV